jgi:hypothetical protein
MPTFWDPVARRALVDRLDRLTTDAPRAWGTFDAAGMVAHLNDAARMATGDLPVRERWMPIRYTPLRQLLIFVLPMPKSAPTAPELLARCRGADLAREREALKAHLEKIANGAALVPHPAFGRLSHAEWGALIWKHSDHHLRQFGA